MKFLIFMCIVVYCEVVLSKSLISIVSLAQEMYNFTVHEINKSIITDVYKNQYVSGILNPT